MSRLVFLLAITIVHYYGIQCAPVGQDYDHSVYMDENEIYQLHWSIKDDEAHFAVQVKTTGWVGFGIANSLSGNMKGADIVIGYVLNGKGYLTDRHAIGYYLPPIDKSNNDYLLTEASESNGETVLKFKRKLDTCDDEDKPIIDGTMRIMYAYNDQDPTPDDESSFAKHTLRGSKSMNLKGYVQNSKIAPGTPHIDVFTDKVKVPSSSTTYWCSVHKVPDLGGKRHITEIEPVIQKGNEGLVHHIIVYGCSSEFDEAHLNASGQCYSNNMPPSVSGCVGRSAAFAWAVGSSTFKLPEHAGMPVGGTETTRYYVMEMHYDNPDKRSDYIDSSGLRFYYTKNLRKYDAGLFQTGVKVNEAMLIPPAQSDFVIHGYCQPECSMKLKSPTALNEDTIKIFGSIPHSHLAGRKVATSLVRDGKEISVIVKDDNYDFNFQQTLLLKDEIAMKAGDGLITTCHYSSEGKKFAIIGGLSNNEEMCLNFVMYYPRQNFSGCNAEEALVEKNFSPKYTQVTGINAWNNVPWTPAMVKELEEVKSSKKAISNCIADGGAHFKDVNGKVYDKPLINDPLPLPKSRCQQASGAGLQSVLTATILSSFTVIFALLL